MVLLLLPAILAQGRFSFQEISPSILFLATRLAAIHSDTGVVVLLLDCLIASCAEQLQFLNFGLDGRRPLRVNSSCSRTFLFHHGS